MKKTATNKKATPAIATITTSPKSEKAGKPKLTKKTTSIETVCEEALGKLKELNIDESLQSEIQWCLGSYHYDQNPSGLYQMAKRALAILMVEKANKTKGVSTKLISDLEKAIGTN